MLLASESVSARLYASRIPLLDGALDCVYAGHIPGGLKANREFAECIVRYEGVIPEDLKTMLFDPQTAGGLLISVAPDFAQELIKSLETAGVRASHIGEVLTSDKPVIEVVP
jgi:selenide,water dikinase